jgi:serpin B
MSRPFAPRSLFALTSAAALAALLPACGSDDGDGTGAGPDDGPSGGAVTPPDDTPPADTSEAKSNLERDLAPAPSDDALKALTDGQAAFALDLYGPLGAEGGNVFYSPLSIHQALTMAFAGAAGTTAAEMAAVLHLGDEPHVAQNALDLSLAAAAQAPVEGEGSPLALEIANAMWGSPRLRWEQAFLDTLALNYGAGLRLTDFAADPEAARVAINDWVEDKTNDRIQDLLVPGIITPETVMVLVNAIFFKASWDTPFEPEATQDADFHLLDGTTAPVPMMRQGLGAMAGAGEGWQAVELPYKGGRATMLLVVPDDLAAFEEHLDEGLYAEILGSLRGGGGHRRTPALRVHGVGPARQDAEGPGHGRTLRECRLQRHDPRRRAHDFRGRSQGVRQGRRGGHGGRCSDRRRARRNDGGRRAPAPVPRPGRPTLRLLHPRRADRRRVVHGAGRGSAGVSAIERRADPAPVAVPPACLDPRRPRVNWASAFTQGTPEKPAGSPRGPSAIQEMRARPS